MTSKPNIPKGGTSPQTLKALTNERVAVRIDADKMAGSKKKRRAAVNTNNGWSLQLNKGKYYVAVKRLYDPKSGTRKQKSVPLKLTADAPKKEVQ